MPWHASAAFSIEKNKSDAVRSLVLKPTIKA
jgi:hypothetical protein